MRSLPWYSGSDFGLIIPLLISIVMNGSQVVNKSEKFPQFKDHLNKTFLEELSYKFWSTKGTRFKASKKLLTKSDLSNKAIGFLSAYLIIFGLLSVYKITGDLIIGESLIAFGSTTLSILLLAFSQMEAAQDYKLRARSFHECALKISTLYDELRIFKTLEQNVEEEKIQFCRLLSKKYQDILEQYPNHDDIDYQIFQTGHQEYFQISRWKAFWTKLVYYRRVKLLYHLLIFAPPAIIFFIIYLNS